MFVNTDALSPAIQDYLKAIYALTRVEPVNPDLIRYLNRLSDALFVLSRYQNHLAGVAEPLWDSRA